MVVAGDRRRARRVKRRPQEARAALMFERFSWAGREAVRDGVAEARRLCATAVGPEHLLIGVASRGAIVVGARSFPVPGFNPEPPVPTNVIRPDDLRRLLREEDPESEAQLGIGIAPRSAAVARGDVRAGRAELRRPASLPRRREAGARARTAGGGRAQACGRSGRELLLGLLREPSRASGCSRVWTSTRRRSTHCSANRTTGSARCSADVEADVQNVAVLDDVGLALEPLLAGARRFRVRAGGDGVVPADHLAADEAARCRVDRVGGLDRSGPCGASRRACPSRRR